MKRVHFFVDEKGNAPFKKWFSSLKDKATQARIQTKIELLQLENFSNCRSIGEGVHELKINFGPGYRVYFAVVKDEIIILFGGGTKQSQNKDIKSAKDNYRRLKHDVH